MRDIPKLTLISIPNSKLNDYTFLKDNNPNIILGLSSDPNNYLEGHRDFITAALMKIPLVSTPNIAYDNLLRENKDYYKAKSVLNFIKYFKEGINPADKVFENARVTLNLYYREDNLYNSLILFLNNLYYQKRLRKEVREKSKELFLISQDRGGHWYSLDRSIITQVIPNTKVVTGTLGLYLYFRLTSNIFSKLIISLHTSSGKVVQEIPVMSNALKNGKNKFIFNSIDKTISYFTLKSEEPFCDIELSHSVLSEGYIQNDSKSLKGCLKYSISDIL